MRENDGIRELGGEFTWSRTKSIHMWLEEGGLRRNWGIGRAVGPWSPWKELEFYPRSKRKALGSERRSDLILILQTVFGMLDGEQNGLGQTWRQGAGDEDMCKWEREAWTKVIALGMESREEIWGVCWKLNVGGGKEGEIIQWRHRALALAKPFGLNTSPRFCLWHPWQPTSPLHLGQISVEASSDLSKN